MSTAKIHRALGVLAWIALLAAVFLYSFAARRVDFWWQLAEGRQILASHHLPTEFGTAFGLPHQPFVDEYSLYEIVLALLDKLGGFFANYVAFVLIFLLIFAVPLARANVLRRGLFDLGLVALVLVFFINRFEQRPELVGLLLLAILLAVFRQTPNFSPRLFIAIGAIFAVWTNVHSSYLIGLLALGLWLADRVTVYTPRWKIAPALFLLATACAAVLVSPYGWHRVAFTFTEEADPGSNLLSREMWAAWNQSPGMQALIVVTAAALGFAFIRQPRPKPWLLALSLALFVLTLFHIRHMSFLTVALLFLATDPARAETNPRRIVLPLAARALACVALLLFDALALRTAIAVLPSNASEQAFAPGLLKDANHAAVLAHDAEGSYIEGHASGIFPLLDSGQMHFNDDTKRFYFFAVQDPYAFDRALDRLPAMDDVLVTAPVAGWTLAMIRRPGWYLAACDAQGLLFSRFPKEIEGYGHLGMPHQPALVQDRDAALKHNDIIGAFCFSTLINTPADSLGLLDRSPPNSWSEPFFSFFRAWVRQLDPEDLRHFLAAHPQPANPLLRDILLAREAPDEPLPPVGAASLERLARILTLLERNDDAGARALFHTIPRPGISPLYYALRDRLDPVTAAHATSFERWQDWNDGGNELFNRAGPLLNARAAQLVRQTGIW